MKRLTYDLSKWKAKNLTDLAYTFSGARSLTELNLSGFTVNSVSYMTCLFQGCGSLTTLNLSGWEINSITVRNDMFKNCNKLNTIYMKECSDATVGIIENQLEADGIRANVTIVR